MRERAHQPTRCNTSQRHPMMEKRRENLLIDAKRCTGCGRCMMACSMKHHNVIDPSLSRVRILRLEARALNVPIICMACETAPCIKVCPMNARVRQANGTVVTDTEVCIGCRACVYICPVGSPEANPFTGQTMTCDMCMADTDEPWCVTACRQEGALTMAKGERLTTSTVRERAGRIRAILPSR
ncbi:4Fe-4S dicluster domain-containing protein [Desulfosarcina ovata]